MGRKNSRLLLGEPAERKPWAVAIPVALMAVTTGCVFAFFFDLPQVLALTPALALWALFRRRSLPLNSRTLTYSVLVPVAAAVVGNSIWPFEVNRFGLFSMLFQPEYLNVALLYFAALLPAFWYPRFCAGWATGIVFFSLCSIGDVANFGEDSARLPWDAVWMQDHYTAGFGLLAGVLTALALWAVGAAEFPGGEGQPRRGMRLLTGLRLGLALAFLPAGWFGVWRLHQRYENEIRAFENNVAMHTAVSWLQRSMQDRREVYFGNEVNLWRTFPPDGGDGSRILLRIEGDAPPGYLRMQAYDFYANGHWQIAAAGGAAPDWETAENGRETALRWQWRDMPSSDGAAEGAESWTFYWSDIFQPRELPFPGDTKEFSLIAAGVEAGADGQLSATSPLFSGGARVSAARNRDSNGMVACPWPRQPDAARHLAANPELAELLDGVLVEIGQETAPLPPEQRMARMQEWFAAHFRYELKTQPPTGDPLRAFLTVERAGHCELFATAAVLLARRCGIPARYVTGFVAYEQPPSGAYYVVREAHAHAWAEYFDAAAGVWRAADWTPDGGAAAFHGDWNFISGGWDRLKLAWAALVSALRNGQIAAVLLALFWNRATPVWLAALAVWWWWRRRRRKQRKIAEGASLSPLQRRWSAEAVRREKRWCVRMKLRRQPAATMEELLDRVERSPHFGDEEKEDARRFVEEYRAMRFGAEECQERRGIE